jgi:hypothetical protein
MLLCGRGKAIDGTGYSCCDVDVGRRACRMLTSCALASEAEGRVSVDPREIIQLTSIETSAFMFLGSDKGSGFPASFILQRYIASANSGK